MTIWQSNVKWVSGQAFAPYTTWECYLAGFHNADYRDVDVMAAAAILADPPRLLELGMGVIYAWPITSAVHLSIPTLNKKAWLGHTACFTGCGAGERSSVAAYWSLADVQREKANDAVWKVYEYWTDTVWKRENYPDRSGQLVFPFMMPHECE